MQIERSLRNTLTQLQQVLSELSNEEYGRPLQILSNSSIGQHTRHIIEFFQTLNSNYDTGVINYDKRRRNNLLETSRDVAQLELESILNNLPLEDKEVLLVGSYSNDSPEEATVRSTYYREIVYNLEHAIHHMAIIKIAIHESTKLLVPTDFGVASATIQYKRSMS